MFLIFRIMMFDQTTQISLIISACMIPDRVSESGNPDFVLTFHCWLYTLYIIVYVTNKNLEFWLQRRLAGAEGPGELWLHRHWFMRSHGCRAQEAGTRQGCSWRLFLHALAWSCQEEWERLADGQTSTPTAAPPDKFSSSQTYSDSWLAAGNSNALSMETDARRLLGELIAEIWRLYLC